ncbi:hypothetical protein AB4Z38_07465 [Arthrobacter sp. 2RAF6]|uniref:hypothetical protein n=1 Tax=Arthrobacter sp. 2RAF6 TaxID=3233002 RepID=UPI003F929C40
MTLVNTSLYILMLEELVWLTTRTPENIVVNLEDVPDHVTPALDASCPGAGRHRGPLTVWEESRLRRTQGGGHARVPPVGGPGHVLLYPGPSSTTPALPVGLSNFRYEKPWRPPSLLLEADPPRHDAPRAALTKILGPREIRRLGESWAADAEELVEDLLARGTEFDAVTDLAAAFPLRVFPDAVRIPQAGRENFLPYGDHVFNAFGLPNELVARGAPPTVNLPCEFSTSRDFT